MKREFQGPKELVLLPPPKLSKPLWWRLTSKGNYQSQMQSNISRGINKLSQIMSR